MGKFQAQHDYLLRNGAYQREHLAWSAYTYDATKLATLQTWLRARLAYLDVAFGYSNAALAAAPAVAPTRPALYPNPAHDYLAIELPAGVGQVTIRDLSGRPVLQAPLSSRRTQLPVAHLAKGSRVVVVESPAAVQVEKLVLN